MYMDNKIFGEYVFYEDGKEIHRSKNILTKFGKRYITQYLAGKNSSPDKDIAIGIGSSSATVNDTQLDFEFYRSAVNLSSVDIQTSPLTGVSTYGVVYKTTIPVDVSGIINEMGLFPSTTFGTTDYASRSISSFEDSKLWIDSVGASPSLVMTSSPKIGAYYLSIDAASSQSKNYFYDFSLDISGYSANDSMTLAYYQSDLNLDYIYFRAYDSNNNYYEMRYPAENAIGYKVKSLKLNNLYSSGFTSGTPDQNSIVKISIGVKAKSSGATNVLLDGLRINDEDSFRSDYGMISRSVLSPGNLITKSLGKQMDIEYRIGLSF
jgi:hypothetical protein